MGNYRFRLSDMIPNAWFYKLRDMSRTRNHQTKKTLPSASTTTQKHHSQPRNSYYYTPRADHFYNSPRIPKSSDTHFPDPPRKSSKRSRTRRKTIYKPSPKHATPNSAMPQPESTQPVDSFPSSTDSSFSPEPNHHHAPSSESTQSFNGVASWTSTCSCRVSSSATDIIIDMTEKSYTKNIEHSNSNGFDSIPEIEIDLPPILTKPAKSNHPPQEPSKTRRNTTPKLDERETCSSLSIKIVKENNTKPIRRETQERKSVSYSGGVKVRGNSPKLVASKKIQGHGRSNCNSLKKTLERKSFSESFAIVKSSFDPEKDFRESMVEMIVENNIRASKDLEELLSCYLSLNSDEYHDLIVKAFEQIWFSLPDF